MPLTKRQFELGLYDEAEAIMHLIYDLLSKRRDLAYSEGELLEMYKGAEERRTGQVHRALEALTSMGAIESGEIQGTLYYAFHQEVNLATLESK